MYAVVRAGGRQFRVQEKQTVVLEKMDGGVGDAVTLGEVLLVGGGEGDVATRVGSPLVPGARVTGTIVRQGKGKKIHAYTYIKVKAHQRHYGHRQLETHVRIDRIEA